MQKNLAAFDFDHTIADENTDVTIVNLLERSWVPSSLRELHRKDGWTAYMQGIFKLCHSHRISEGKITETIKKIKCVKGVDALIRRLKNELNFDIIIISDSNSYFIDKWLEKNAMRNCVEKVFTNPAQFVDGLLEIQMYHLQDSCKLSTKNLCKGQILDDFVKARSLENVHYNSIVYVGDGTNDFCPILRLNQNDLACVRNNYKCAELIKSVLTGSTKNDDGENYDIKAKVVFWDNGNDIFEAVEGLVKND